MAKDVTESLAGDPVVLREGSLQDEIVPIKVIQPGWGSSGYYPPEVLERDGPQVFTAGTKMFWDHATESEERERPEGSLDDLAGELITNAQWNEHGREGPGLYADAKVFGRFKDAVNELAPHIGVSIRALGKAEKGEVEGRKGPIIKEISAARSVDFVTIPGAGGKVVQLFEAYRDAVPENPYLPEDYRESLENQEHEAEAVMDEKAIQELKDQLQEALDRVTELDTINTALRGHANKLSAEKVAREALRDIELPEPSKERVLTLAVEGELPLGENGALDQDALIAKVKEAASAERAYVASLTEAGGDVRGLGASGSSDNGGAKLKESLKSMWLKLGKSVDEAEKLATIAANGR